jgi:hypothetical protein
MGKYEFKQLRWLQLTETSAKAASSWYDGAGWYVNTYDDAASNGERPYSCIAKSDGPNPVPFLGQFLALKRCGAEGWSVGAFVPAAPEGPYFILQRRAAS